MTRKRKALIVFAGLMVLFVPLVYGAAPIYLFFAEDNPAMLGPFGWTAAPDDAPYVEGRVAPGYRDAADTVRDEFLAHRAAIHAPALSAAVAVDGEAVWSAAAGWADLETRREATPDTIFRIGSTSKAVTGTLLARLVDKGVIDLDEPISVYVEDLPNPAWGDITCRQLASHTAGIPSYETNRDWAGVYRAIALRESHEDVREGLDYFDDSPLIFEPGTDFEYSSFDINLLSVVMQEAAGRPFQELMRMHVTEPLSIDTPLSDGPHPDRASFYILNGAMVREWWDADLSHKMAGGGFMAKPADLARLGSAWLDDEFIAAETRKRFWTPQKLADGSVNEQRYAISWRFYDDFEIDGKKIAGAHHGGVAKGAMCWLVVLPERNMAVAMAINTRVTPFSEWSSFYRRIVTIFSESAPNPESIASVTP